MLTVLFRLPDTVADSVNVIRERKSAWILIGFAVASLLLAEVPGCAEQTPPPRAPPRPLPEPPKPAAIEPPKPPPTHIVLGPMALDVIASRTAQLFHVVDQLSMWSPFSHPQYAKWAKRGLALDDDDRAALAKHARVRRARGWGSGIEAAFYVSGELDDAIATAVEGKKLTADEALVEHEVMAHFATKLDPILTAQRPAIDAFVAALAQESPQLAALAERFARAANVTGPIAIAVIPVVDPAPGGKANASIGRSRITLEIEDGSDPMPPFEHAFFHALVMKKRESIAIAAAKCKAEIDEETLTQAIAYALAPGLLHGGSASSDPLALEVDAHRAATRTLRAPVVRYERLALAVRPMLVESLDTGGGFSAFLPRACEAWIDLAKH